MTFFRDWQTRYAHLPWFRRYGFLAIAALVWTAGGIFLLPPFGRPDTFVAISGILGWYFVGFALAILVITDREKPVILKRAASLTIITLFFWLFYRYSGTRWERVQEQFFNFERMDGVWALYAQGLWVTLQISVVAALLSLLFGLLLGIIRSLHNPVLDPFLGSYIDFFRAMPLIVNMVLVFYALPFVGINLSAFWAATTSLVLMNSAYQAEIFRAGIESVSRGQVDASRALGLKTHQTLRYVVLPQSFRIILPPLTNNLVSLVKDTAVAYVITLPELLTQAQHAVTWKRTPTPLVLSMFIYLATLIPLIRLTRYIEHRNAKWTKA